MLVAVGLVVVRDEVEETPVLAACVLAVGLVASLGRVVGFGVVVLLVVDVAGDDACVAGFFSVDEIVDLRSVEGAAGFAWGLEDVLPARDIRFAVAEIPFFSSPELAIDLLFSSAELALAEGRDR